MTDTIQVKEKADYFGVRGDVIILGQEIKIRLNSKF